MIKLENMKKKLLLGFLFLGIVLSIVLFICNDWDLLKSKPEYVAPKGYQRLTRGKEVYMLDLMNIPRNKMSSWRLYANVSKSFIYYCYKNGKWITPTNNTFLALKSMALHNAFGGESSKIRGAFYIDSKFSESLPPLSGMKDEWEKNKKDFDAGKWFR